MSHIKKAIGERIRTLRTGTDTSQDALAVASGVHRDIIGHIERGERDYRIDSLLRVIQALHADPSDTVFTQDPGVKKLHDSIARIYADGTANEVHFIMEALRYAEAMIDSHHRGRASPSGKASRSA